MDLLGSRVQEEDDDEFEKQQQALQGKVAVNLKSPAPPPPPPPPPPTRCQSHGGYSSAKVSYSSKSLLTSLSVCDDGALAAAGDYVEESKAGSRRRGRELRRLVSWSRYLEGGGNEQAVEEAEEWMIDLSQLLLGPKFASGAHSRLYHGIYQGKTVAVKVTRHPQGPSGSGGEELRATLDRLFSREVSLLSKLHHPNIVQLIGACKRPPVCCVVTEYLEGGSLRDYLSRNAPLPLDTIFSMALDIAHGMQYLHSQGVVHRDLKSANLILNHDFTVKITDFGVATIESDCHTVTSDVGTYRWMAPELVNRKAHSKKVDTYSFGIVLWELITGKIPFLTMTPIQAAYAVVNKNMRPEVPSHCPSVLARLMEECWSLDPNRRPDFDQVVKILRSRAPQSN